jgi:ELWxxDGT repeat protein
MIKKALFVVLTVFGSTSFAQPNCVYLESDIYPGSYGSLPVSLTEFNSALYFRCTGNSSGPELWKYENGVTSMVADINPGLGGSIPNQLTVLGSSLYFTASTAATGTELFKYDGISVSLVADINPGSGSSSVSYLTAVGTELYFSANDGVSGSEPWKYDGTVVSQVGDINPGSAGSNPDEFAGAAGFVFFTGTHPSYGFELWKYDGATAVIQDLYPGTSGSDLGELTTIGSKICFRATNGTQGYELWTHDGVAPICLDVCTTGPGDFTPWEFTTFGTEVFFRGFIQATGYELWKYDGTTASLVADVFPGGGNAHPNHIIGGSTILYFAANNGATGNELWKYDGVTASLIGDIYPGSTSSMPYGWTEKFETMGDDLLLIADDGVSGNEVWRYDGTTLYQGKDIVSGSASSNPSGLIGHNNSLYFMADNMINGGELWVWKIYNDLTDSINVQACDDYTSPGGNVYSGDGVYNFTDIIPSIGCPGCDSIIDVNLTISQNPSSSQTLTTCDSYTSPAGGYYNLIGNYVFTDIIPSIACPGADSIIDIDLTIQDNLNTAITVFQGVVFVSESGATYQWLDCDNNLAPIPGANNQDYLPTVDGNYACEITLSLCSDTSACAYVVASENPGSELSEQADANTSVYPNPVSGKLFVSNTDKSLMSTRIFNVLGSEIMLNQKEYSESIQIDMTDFAIGVYYLEISTKKGNFIRKVIKE